MLWLQSSMSTVAHELYSSAETAPTRLAVTLNKEESADPPQVGSTAPADAPTGSGVPAGNVLAPYQPPPQRAEIPPPAPSPQALWVAGHWHWSWSGVRYVWTPGRYIERPQPNANWLPGYWEQHAGGWIWVEGRWI
jgi:hypothetical protein